MKRELWELEWASDGTTEMDVRGYLAHGHKTKAGIWRYGAPLPSASLPGWLLLVDEGMRSALMRPELDFEQVGFLVTTAPDDDWTQWRGNWMRSALRLKERFSADEWLELVLPWDVPRDADLDAVRLLTGQRGVLVTEKPPLYIVRSQVQLAFASERRVFSSSHWGAGLHQIPGAMAGRLAVEGSVRDVLEKGFLEESVDFVPLKLS